MSRADAIREALKRLKEKGVDDPFEKPLRSSQEVASDYVSPDSSLFYPAAGLIDTYRAMTGRGAPKGEDVANAVTENPVGNYLVKQFVDEGLPIAGQDALGAVGSINVRNQKKKLFGTNSQPPPGPRRDKQQGLIQDYANKEFGVELSPSKGKINQKTGERRMTPKQAAAGIGEGELKPDWRGGKVESQWNPDAMMHELGHVHNMPDGVGIGEHQTNMDAQVGQAEKIEKARTGSGYGAAFRHPEEVQARSMENPMRREIGIPAAKHVVKDPETGRTKLFDDPTPRSMVGMDEPAGVRVPSQRAGEEGKYIEMIRQSRTALPETKARMDLRRSGDMSFDPETGWAPDPDRLGGKIQDYIGNKVGSLGEAAQGQSFDQLKGQGLLPPEPPQIKNVNPGLIDASEVFQQRGQQPMSPDAKLSQMYNGPDVRDAVPQLMDRAKEEIRKSYAEGFDSPVEMNENNQRVLGHGFQKSALDNPMNAPAKPPVNAPTQEQRNMARSLGLNPDELGPIDPNKGLEWATPEQRAEIDKQLAAGEVKRKAEMNKPKTYYPPNEGEENVLAPRQRLDGAKSQPTLKKNQPLPENVTPINDSVRNRPAKGEPTNAVDAMIESFGKKPPGGRGPSSVNAVAAMPNVSASAPQGLQQSSGLSPEEESRFQELDRKYGGKSNLNAMEEKRFQELKSKFGNMVQPDQNPQLETPSATDDVNNAVQSTYPATQNMGQPQKRNIDLKSFWGKAEAMNYAMDADKKRYADHYDDTDEHGIPIPEEQKQGLRPTGGTDFGSHGALTKAMDYGTGLLRTAGADAISQVGKIAGYAPFVKNEDLVNALSMKAPSWGEYMKKAEMPEMSVDLKPYQTTPMIGKYLPDKVSLRDGLGFLGDMATDKFAAGNNQAGLLSAATKDAGESVYNSGFKKVQAGIDANPRQLSGKIGPVMQKEGFTGSMGEAVPAMRTAKRKAFDDVKGILQQADAKGAQVDMDRAVKEAQAYVDDLRANALPDGTMDAHIDELQNRIDKFKSQGAHTKATPQGPNTAVLAENTKQAVEGGHPTQPMTVLRDEGKELNFGLQKQKGRPVNVIQETKPGAAFEQPEYPLGDPRINVNEPLPPLKEGQKWADKSRSLPQGVKLEDVPGPSTMKGNRWKSLMYNRAGGRAYQVDVSNPYKTEFEKRLAAGHKAAIEEAVGKTVGEDAAGKVALRNADYGTLTDSLKPAKTLAKSEVTPNVLSWSDLKDSVGGGVLAKWLLHNPAVAAAAIPATYVAKKGVQFANTVKGRTNIGQGLINLGESGVADQAFNRAVVNSRKKSNTKD